MSLVPFSCSLNAAMTQLFPRFDTRIQHSEMVAAQEMKTSLNYNIEAKRTHPTHAFNCKIIVQ